MIATISLWPLVALAMSGLAFAAAAHQTRHPALMTQEEIEARYHAEHKFCEQFSEQAQDICRQHARAHRDYARQIKHDAQLQRHTEREKRKAQYRYERAKCDSMVGAAKAECIAEAKRRCR